MLNYLLKRLLLFVPIFLLISMLIFGLSKATPGDPAERLLTLEGGATPTGGSNSLAFFYQQYQQEVSRLGLNKPPFYFSYVPAAYPDSLFKYNHPYRKKAIRKLLAKYGNWSVIEAYYRDLERFESQLFAATATNGTTFNDAKRLVSQIFKEWKKNPIEQQFINLRKEIKKDSLVESQLSKPLKNLQKSFLKIEKNATPHRLNFPKIVWHGTTNQYHHWLANFLKGDFGISLINGQPVTEKVKTAIGWTLILNGLALIFTYLIAVPLGVFAARKAGTTVDFQISFWSFLLYSLPVFWVGTLMLTLFATPDFGLHFVHTGLCSLPSSAPFWQRFGCQAKQMILPIICLTYPSLAFLIRQMRGSMVSILKEDYMQTAAAKGLTEQKFVWKHAFRNALFPMITIFATIFPRLIAGSVIVEVIFNLPGMGWLLLESIRAQDYPVVYVVLLFGAALTMVGMLVADVVYVAVDPRVTLGDSELKNID